MNNKTEKDEYLEALWHSNERGGDSLEDFKVNLHREYKSIIVNELVLDGLIKLSGKGHKIDFTQKGEDRARNLIRAHRLAERLLFDVLGRECEQGACEFEHIVSLELVDSICTLLGHPKKCPHGLPIPEGDCCRRLAKTAQSSVIGLAELEIGQSARVAYVNSRNDQQMHKLNGLHIRPGVIIKVHQKYPAYVIESEGASIALDKEIVNNIYVWKPGTQMQPKCCKGSEGRGHAGKGRRRRFRFRRRGR